MSNTVWEGVQLARLMERPTARAYIGALFADFIELHGDRGFGDDGAVIGGIAMFGERAVTVVAEEKGVGARDRSARNFGCPNPEGYRKSLRLMKQAEKFRRPVICFVDTQGAYCGTGAEERGQGEAIAMNLREMTGLTVPVVSVVLGEGGSGGALALAVANHVAMLENAVYSIASPESFAAILWKDASRASEAAEVMKITAQDLKRLGVIDTVIPEPEGGAQNDPARAEENVRRYLEEALDALSGLSGEELARERFARFRAL